MAYDPAGRLESVTNAKNVITECCQECAVRKSLLQSFLLRCKISPARLLGSKQILSFFVLLSRS